MLQSTAQASNQTPLVMLMRAKAVRIKTIAKQLQKVQTLIFLSSVSA